VYRQHWERIGLTCSGPILSTTNQPGGLPAAEGATSSHAGSNASARRFRAQARVRDSATVCATSHLTISEAHQLVVMYSRRSCEPIRRGLWIYHRHRLTESA
jgi:hypothetical protein